MATAGTTLETMRLVGIGLDKIAEVASELAGMADLITDLLSPTDPMPGCARYSRWIVTERYGMDDEQVTGFADYWTAYEYLCHQAVEPAALEEARLHATRGMEAGQPPIVERTGNETETEDADEDSGRSADRRACEP